MHQADQDPRSSLISICLLAWYVNLIVEYNADRKG